MMAAEKFSKNFRFGFSFAILNILHFIFYFAILFMQICLFVCLAQQVVSSELMKWHHRGCPR